MKSNLKNMRLNVKPISFASFAIALSLLWSQTLIGQQDLIGVTPPVVFEDRQVATADFEPMEVPEKPIYGSVGAKPFTNDIPSPDEFTISDELEAELKHAENEASGAFAGIREQFADLDLAKMLGSLAIVLGSYFGLVWVLRKLGPAASRGLPTEVVEVLGATPFGPKKQLQVIRLGSKLLLLINSSEGSQLIGEVADPDEVEYLASLCRGKRRAQPRQRSTGRSAERARPEATVPQPPQAADNLRDVLQQLQSVVRSQPKGSVFEA